jgi:hypothetical protein
VFTQPYWLRPREGAAELDSKLFNRPHTLRGVLRVTERFVRWCPPLNRIVRNSIRRSITTFEGLDAPWSHIERSIPDLRIRPAMLGAVYVAWGTKPESIVA